MLVVVIVDDDDDDDDEEQRQGAGTGCNTAVMHLKRCWRCKAWLHQIAHRQRSLLLSKS